MNQQTCGGAILLRYAAAQLSLEAIDRCLSGLECQFVSCCEQCIREGLNSRPFGKYVFCGLIDSQL
jgi:hypothetical protein